ncbi:MAG: GNAT family N-acetyltransferase [Frankiaceae bacterium]
MPGVKVLRSAEVPARRLAQVRALLDAAFGDGFSAEDWEHCLGGWHVLRCAGDVVVAHAAVVPRVLEIGARPVDAGYVEGVATLPGRQGHGLGTSVMRAAGELVTASFELGALSTSRHGFYARLGWLRWRGPTYVRRGTELVRTADEDDGIMVLRHASSPPIELTEPIACTERSGDDW